jgi:hypothetical protein
MATKELDTSSAPERGEEVGHRCPEGRTIAFEDLGNDLTVGDATAAERGRETLHHQQSATQVRELDGRAEAARPLACSS